MRKNKSIFLLLTMILLSNCAQSQTKTDINNLYSRLQQCVDASGHTDYCNRQLYNSLDSLLNISYKNLHHKLNPSRQKALQKEEREWIKKRDINFIKFEKEVSTHDGASVPGTEIYETLLYEKKNEFVRKRLITLIDRL